MGSVGGEDAAPPGVAVGSVGREGVASEGTVAPGDAPAGEPEAREARNAGGGAGATAEPAGGPKVAKGAP